MQPLALSFSKKSFLNALAFSFLFFNPVIVFLLSKSVVLPFVIIVIVTIIILQTITLAEGIKVILLNFLVLISIFIHFEVLFRFGFPELIIENLYEIKQGYYFNKSNLVKDIQDKEYQVLYKTNVQGFRMPASFRQDKRIDRCDWIFIGDSFTQGAQVEFKDLYTSQVYRNHPDKVIVNAGISGFGIIEELAYYKHEAYKLNPKKVILQLCTFNDFMKVEKSRNSFADYLMQYSDFARFILYNLKNKSPGELPLGRWTEPFYPSEGDNRDYNIFFNEKSAKQKKDIEKFKKTLMQFQNEVEKNGSELLVFLIPTKEQSYLRYRDEVLTNFNIPESSIDLTYPNRLLKEICYSLDINYIDLLDGVKESRQNIFFEYDEHLNEYGHYLLAQLIEPFFQDSSKNFQPTLVSDNFLGERYPSCINGSLLFQASRDGNMELFIKDLESNSETRLTFNNVDESHPTLNLARNVIAFTEGDASELNTKVGLLDLRTFSRTYIPNGGNTFSAIPTFSNDGQFICYVEWDWDPSKKSFSLPSIVVSPMDSLGMKFYITNQDSLETWRPVFTPDGNSIVYIAKQSDNFDLFITKLSDLSTRQLTFTPYDEWDPIVSPDGEKVYYAAYQSGNWDLFEFSIKNNSTQRLTNTVGDEWDPQVCTSSNSLFFAGEFGFFNCIYSKAL